MIAAGRIERLGRARLAWRWRGIVRSMGLPGLIAAAMLLVSASLVFIVEPLQQRQLDGLQAEADGARREALRRAREDSLQQAAVRRSAGTQWLEDLPALAEREPRVAELLGRAVAHGLVAKRSEYRYGSEAGSSVARYRISLPVVGSYEGLRGYLEDVLSADPALVLDSVRLRRAQAQATQVQAELQFSLVMREPAAAQAAPAGVRP